MTLGRNASIRLCIMYRAFTRRDARGSVFCKYVNVYALGLWISKDAYHDANA